MVHELYAASSSVSWQLDQTQDCTHLRQGHQSLNIDILSTPERRAPDPEHRHHLNAGIGVCQDHGATVQANSQVPQQLTLPGQPLPGPDQVDTPACHHCLAVASHVDSAAIDKPLLIFLTAFAAPQAIAAPCVKV